MIKMRLLKCGGGTSSRSHQERRQGTVILSPAISVKGGLRHKDGGDPSWL